MTEAARSLDRVEQLLAERREDDARDELRALADDASALDPALLPRAASLCERIGMVSAAVGLIRRRIETSPRDHEAWSRLAALHDELGDSARGARCRRRARELAPDQTPPPDPGDAIASHPSPGRESPPLVDIAFEDSDLVRFLDLFDGREDHHARQWYDAARDRGGYSPVPAALGPAALRRHLDGRQTLGVYLLRADDTVRFCVLDLDARRTALAEAAGQADRVQSLAEALDAAGRELGAHLTRLDLPWLYEDSGHKGRHLWMFFDSPVAAGTARDFGRAVLATAPELDDRLSIEFFPKQAHATGKGLGNLVKLPLGVHRVSGRRALLLNSEGVVEQRPFELLRAVQRVPSHQLREMGRAVGAIPSEPARARGRTPTPTPSQRWSVNDFRADPQFRDVLSGCAVLRRVVDRALAGDAVEHSALVAIRHTLGHLDHGPAGVNFLQRRVPRVPGEQHLGSPLRGKPASCANLRRRLPGVARKVGCNCRFAPGLPTYPHPLLHLGGSDRGVRLRLVEGEAPSPKSETAAAANTEQKPDPSIPPAVPPAGSDDTLPEAP